MDQSNNQQIQVKATDEVIKGVYSNVMELKGLKDEFCLDFFNVFPPIGAMTARIVISPGHMKRMVKVLQQGVNTFEEKFGKIEEAEEPSKPRMGFN